MRNEAEKKLETKSWRTLCATEDLQLYFDDSGEAWNGFEQGSAMTRFLQKMSFRQLCGLNAKGTTSDGKISKQDDGIVQGN